MKCLFLILVIFWGGISASAYAHENEVSIKIKGSKRCITSNGSPTHDIGEFPNSGNPNSFREQRISVCVDAMPKKTGTVNRRANGSGISITGIIFRPGTADWYDGSTRRGFSRDRSSGWNLEGMGPGNTLGMDQENAHVDNRGLYHYHAVSPSLAQGLNGSLMGYAADGFEIHYIGDQAASSWRLKLGTRPTPPYGTYDGSYNEDYEYVAGSGNLDECNGAISNGNYNYFATDRYPFFPRCFLGTVSDDFLGRP
jgi:hypothetical protein